ncbi:23S rRNA pseudouridine(2604) synthase RluF [Algoriphagus antarcticus]|uniref:Pseudouridine synthase n=1 Tax=Algoriphagus antarcticus TaxID=238540 RepID=A0A3E0DVR1_9BACT|nr:23S rRNA pseudouridine(2604) synthase RluF [Algoriphagus antarcticus]REG88531.1 pseudouridine synthase [Algoriphagus antarcticus]
MEANQQIRINKYLSEVGFCSRRAADKLLEEGRITINGKVPELGTKVGPKDMVEVDGNPIGKPIQAHIYIAFNKPVGIVSTTDTKGEKDNIIDYIGHSQRIFPIGRLDKDSEGLIFLTSEGDIVNKILRSKNNHEKEYIVTVDRPVNDEFIKLMSSGVPILDTVTDPCKVERISKFKFRIILAQGLNRQIRRMCDHFGFKVVQLRRIRIMNVHLDIPVGKWRDLTEKELAEIKEMVSDSSKTFD